MLIKYTGKYVKIYFIIKITFFWSVVAFDKICIMLKCSSRLKIQRNWKW